MANAYPSTSTSKLSVYETITQRIIEKLEAGVIPWNKPWATYQGQPTLCRNLLSQKPYRGINALLTNVAGYSSPFWLTYKQAASIGGHVNAGEKSTPICFWKFGESEKEQPDGEITKKEWAMCRMYSVFNLEQCEIPGLKIDDTPAPGKVFEPIANCEEILAKCFCKPEIKHGGDKAFYSPGLDYIGMPKPEAFDSPEFYYSVLFHELTHSTGHPNRLNRDGIGKLHGFGSHEYSKEELIAEMGSAFVSGYAGIETAQTLKNSTAYLQSWIRVLKGDSKLVITAASAAQKAADLILGSAVASPSEVANG